MCEVISQRVDEMGAGWTVGYLGADVQAALQTGSREPFDCIILDLDLGDGVLAWAHLDALAALGAPVIIVSAAGDPQQVQQAIGHGACSYLPKQSGLPQLDEVMASAAEGRCIITPDLAGKLAVPQVEGVAMTEDEERALMLRSSGMSAAAIGSALGVSSEAAEQLMASAVDRYRTH